jgi:hypothetical protein
MRKIKYRNNSHSSSNPKCRHTESGQGFRSSSWSGQESWSRCGSKSWSWRGFGPMSRSASGKRS